MKKSVLVVLSSVLFAAGGWFTYSLIGEPEKIQAKAAPVAMDHPLRVGIFPRRSYQTTKKSFQPLVDHLSRELGVEVKLVLFTDFKNFWSRLTDKEFDLVHFNQYHYVKAKKEVGYNVIVANEEFGKKDMAGAITVRADSDIHTLEDLKGKVISFGGGPKAMASYIAPTSVLKKAGLEPGKDYTVNFSLSPPKAVINTFSRVSDAGGSGDVVIDLKVVTDKIDIKQLKVLAKSERFTHLPWAVSDTLPMEVSAQISQIMTHLADSREGKEILKSARVSSFYAVRDSDFDKVRSIVEYTLGQSYWPEPRDKQKPQISVSKNTTNMPNSVPDP